MELLVTTVIMAVHNMHSIAGMFYYIQNITPISHSNLQPLSIVGAKQWHAFISSSPYLQHIFVSAHLCMSSDEATQNPKPASRIRRLLQNPHPDSQRLFGLIRLVKMESFLYLLLCLVLTHLPCIKKPHTLTSKGSKKEVHRREHSIKCPLIEEGGLCAQKAWSHTSPAVSGAGVVAMARRGCSALKVESQNPLGKCLAR